MPVPTALTDLSATAASNSPSGSETVGSSLDDYLRGIQAVLRGNLAHKGADIASATTTDLGAVVGLFNDITGTTTITGFGTVGAGVWKVIKFEGALTLTHNATSLILPGGANITTADGDIAIVVSEGSGNWRCVSYQKASGAPIRTAPVANSIGADVNLNNTGSYFDGPSCAQGTAGTWFASGTVTLTDTAGAATFNVKLWDGTTVIASARESSSAGNQRVTISLSGYLTTPAGNIKISVNDETSTSGLIISNGSSNSKDSTLTAIRIG